ncbi:MAG: bifunctional diaminohydroxyphosphoribosylaminopyrimidine deaminase/5-amino-6-(5-phosphoribosylamino)uracil reductase RibD [Flavobacteriaceae bacterium]|nr:bifunctional diaminohydroxyphosphoribosylaminopyrimidine deaminase/5-amino-6-(5-phosphoribosylamino)uracil reductase RibD [Flavobacteriaceae bacterium]
MKIHEKYIRRCLKLAKNGLGLTYPNPLVGSVIIDQNNNIIGEGWHKKAGEPHAEVNAINSVKNKELLAKSTIYINLEPCSHFGKTPPCADLIIKHQIPNVVIGCIDSFSKVSGSGIAKLEKAGCKVTVGVLEKECLSINKRFFTFHNKKRPYIILKWAQTKDLFIDKTRTNSNKHQPVTISNTYSRQLTHKWRTQEQAILVGTNTVINDNPSLNSRLFEGNNPVRVFIDKTLKVKPNSNILDNTITTICLTQNKAKDRENIKYISLDFDKDVPTQICNILYNENLQSLIIEGGSYTLQSFIDINLWDEARIFTSENRLHSGVKSANITGETVSKTTIVTDSLEIIKNTSHRN